MTKEDIIRIAKEVLLLNDKDNPNDASIAQFIGTLSDFAALDAALEQPDATHPGYIIGSHWLETAYSRIAAGEAEAEVLAEVLGERGWAKREPATHEQVFAAYGATVCLFWLDYRAGWRAAERFHGIRKEDT
jgi:hypothetical protein